jgi:hypothetical protein
VYLLWGKRFSTAKRVAERLLGDLPPGQHFWLMDRYLYPYVHHGYASTLAPSPADMQAPVWSWCIILRVTSPPQPKATAPVWRRPITVYPTTGQPPSSKAWLFLVKAASGRHFYSYPENPRLK